MYNSVYLIITRVFAYDNLECMADIVKTVIIAKDRSESCDASAGASV